MVKTKIQSFKNTDNINFLPFIRDLWRYKFLLIVICIILASLSNLYVSNKIYLKTSEIKIKEPSIEIFSPFQNIYLNELGPQPVNLKQNYVDRFVINLNTMQNFTEFLQKSNNFKDIKDFLKTNNFTANEYFRKKFFQKSLRNVKIKNTFVLNFPEFIQGNIFLNEYVIYIRDITIEQTKSDINYFIKNSIENDLQNLKIAEKIQLETPLIVNLNDNAGSLIVIEPISEFYKGTKVLEEKIKIKKEILTKLEKNSFLYDPIQDTASLPKFINKPKKTLITLVSFFVGFVFFTIILIFKKILKQS